MLPWLCLKGISTGAMQEALEASLGPRSQRSVCGATISRLKSRWEDERRALSERDLASKRYVCFNVRMDEDKQCHLCDGGRRQRVRGH